jgi:hypothetical protein
MEYRVKWIENSTEKTIETRIEAISSKNAQDKFEWLQGGNCRSITSFVVKKGRKFVELPVFEVPVEVVEVPVEVVEVPVEVVEVGGIYHEKLASGETRIVQATQCRHGNISFLHFINPTSDMVASAIHIKGIPSLKLIPSCC